MKYFYREFVKASLSIACIHRNISGREDIPTIEGISWLKKESFFEIGERTGTDISAYNKVDSSKIFLKSEWEF